MDAVGFTECEGYLLRITQRQGHEEDVSLLMNNALSDVGDAAIILILMPVG